MKTGHKPLAFALIALFSIAAHGQDAEFDIETSVDLGPVNRHIMGGNFEFISTQAPEIAALAEGMPIARFPGGDADSSFLWNDPDLIHPTTGLSSYGWNAFANLASANHIPLLLELNIVRGTSSRTPLQNALDWIAAAQARGLSVPYVGIGNEVWGDWDAGHAAFPTAALYAAQVRAYATAIHAAYPNIKVVLSIGTHNEDAWNAEAIRLTADAIDAVDYHFYPNHHDCDPNCPNVMEVVGGADSMSDNIARIRQMLIDEAGTLHGNRIEIVVGEWDGAADVPFPAPVANTRYMQWSMADALFYGAAIGEMLHGGVAAAMHYEAQGYRFGLIGGNYGRTADLSIKRPKAFALQLWRERFGDRLVRANRVSSPTFEQSGPTAWDGTAGTRDYVKVYASLTNDGRSLKLIVVNRHPTDDMQTQFNLNDFLPTATANTWTVAGDSIMAQNENITGGSSTAARIVTGTASASGSTLTWTVPAHSVNAIELVRDDLLLRDGFESAP